MKSLYKSRAWIWIGSIVLVVLLGSLAYIYLPGRGNLPALQMPNYWPTNGWQTSTPEQQGIDSTRLTKEIQSIQEQHLAIDSLMIIRNGYVILDAYFAPYDGSFAHDLASVTKSVTTSLVGIAIDQGLLELEQPVVSFFSERTIANLDERKKRITIRDLVSMRNGMESGCLEGDEVTLDTMRSSPDWVQAALDRKMMSEPDTHFCYDSLGMHLLSAILQQVTGMTELDFARQVLFEPLGIHDVIWKSDPQGYNHGWGDMYLKPADASKLGYLWLHNGVWEGQQIVSAKWVSASVTAHSRMVGSEYGYGYGWWVSPVDFYAMGKGGQFIRVVPSKNMVFVITGGEFNIDEIQSFLLGFLFNTRRQLKANPTGNAELAAALSSTAQANDLHPSIPSPDLAMKISGQAYACSDNPAQVSSLRLEFPDPAVAWFHMVQHGQDVFWPLGLDGHYRIAEDGQATAGYWQDASTFVLEIFNIGQLTRELQFEGNIVHVTVPEFDLAFDCSTQTP